jgi:hypothetical protein
VTRSTKSARLCCLHLLGSQPTSVCIFSTRTGGLLGAGSTTSEGCPSASVRKAPSSSPCRYRLKRYILERGAHAKGMMLVLILSASEMCAANRRSPCREVCRPFQEFAEQAIRPPARRAAQPPDAPNDPVTALAVRLPQHPNEHRPERSVLLAVDQELGEGAGLRVRLGRCPIHHPLRSRRRRLSPSPHQRAEDVPRHIGRFMRLKSGTS